MAHALIIGDNILMGRTIQSRLETLGFSSFDRSWSEEQAVAAASCRPPDLIVIGDAIEGGSAVSAARRITRSRAVPVLMMTVDPDRPGASMAAGESFDGPYRPDQIGEALRQANKPDAA